MYQVKLCLNIPEMWKSDAWGCWPIQPVTAWDTAALLPMTAIALLVGLLLHFSRGNYFSFTHEVYAFLQ